MGGSGVAGRGRRTVEGGVGGNAEGKEGDGVRIACGPSGILTATMIYERIRGR